MRAITTAFASDVLLAIILAVMTPKWMKLLPALVSTMICSSCFSQDFTIKNFNPQDSSKNYYVVYNTPLDIQGVLVLLPGFGDPAISITKETYIVKSAIEHGLMTVCVSLQDGAYSFCIDSISQHTLSVMIADLYRTYKLENKKLYVGGFSLGGSGAVRYYEIAMSGHTNIIRPAAVFGVDPPLDFTRFYASMDFHLKEDITLTEPAYFLPRMRFEFKGTPKENYASYVSTSPYVYHELLSNSRILKHAPLMLITEPDIEWQLYNRNRDYNDLNAFDCAGMIRELRSLGNTDAILVTTTNKGYRRGDNARNPHSWSIADAEKTVKWLLQY